MTPQICVVIPTHNRASLLGGAIESVLASPLLVRAQDVIVVDDASTDDTAEVAGRYGVRYERVAGNGPSGTRNAGLALAEREFVAFLDDDDRWLAGNMAEQLEALSEHPDAAFAYGRVQLTTFDLHPFGTAVPPPPLPSGAIAGFLLLHDLQLGAILFRRSMLAGVGFDPLMRFNEDLDLLLRLAAVHDAVGVDHVGSLFRQRAPNGRDAGVRWDSHRTRVAAMRKWRALGVLPTWREVIRAEISYRGLTSFYFCEDARVRLDLRQRREAVQSLLYALRVSAPHTLLGHRRFWSVLPAFLRPAAT